VIHEAAERALRAVSKYPQCEAYASSAVVHTVYIDNSKISNIETKRDDGLMVRMIDGDRQGKASVSLCRDSSVDDCVRMAESVLKFSPSTPNMNGYATPGKARHAMPDVWDKRVEHITPDELRELARAVIDNCRVNIPRAQIRVSTHDCVTMNGNGVDCSHRSTLVYGHFTSMAVRDHPGEGMETYHGTHLDLDPVEIGQALSRKAEAAAVCTEFKGHEKLSMILPPSELGDMITSSVGSAIDGENVKYGTSLWKDSVGQQVASKELTMVEDPTARAPLSCVFDDEGTPTERRPVIENGVLRGFNRDCFCGDSTGNGMRRSSVEAQGAYERTPVIKPLNLGIAPGRFSREDIVEQTDSGILVEKFAWPEADELTGRFGLNVRCGYVIKRGEIVATVNNALLMGNMIDAVANVEMIGNDPKHMGVANVPTMSFSGTELVGNRGIHHGRRSADHTGARSGDRMRPRRGLPDAQDRGKARLQERPGAYEGRVQAVPRVRCPRGAGHGVLPGLRQKIRPQLTSLTWLGIYR
jgi:PmbA protein